MEAAEAARRRAADELAEAKKLRAEAADFARKLPPTIPPPASHAARRRSADGGSFAGKVICGSCGNLCFAATGDCPNCGETLPMAATPTASASVDSRMRQVTAAAAAAEAARRRRRRRRSRRRRHRSRTDGRRRSTTKVRCITTTRTLEKRPGIGRSGGGAAVGWGLLLFLFDGVGAAPGRRLHRLQHRRRLRRRAAAAVG